MTIGATPLMPLYRVQPLPDARLQRFGVNRSQLFGKPMVEFTAPEVRPSQGSTPGPATTPLHEAQTRNQPFAPPTPVQSAGTQPGTLVDLKA